MDTKSWWQSNTIRVALAAILAAWAAYCAGELGLDAAIMSTVGSVIAIFLRRGATVPIKTAGVVLLMVCLVGCGSTSGSVTPTTGTTTTGGYVVGGEQEAAGGTYIGVGGNTTYNIHPKPGQDIPEKVTDSIAKVLENEQVPIEAKNRFLDAMAKLYGFSVTLTNTGHNTGNVDLAGATGRSGIPPMVEPDPPETEAELAARLAAEEAAKAASGDGQ